MLKLLSKDAMDRYQSAASLAADLERCRGDWEATGGVEPFPLDSLRALHFQLPEKLYGREAETARLLRAFERTNASHLAEVLGGHLGKQRAAAQGGHDFVLNGSFDLYGLHESPPRRRSRRRRGLGPARPEGQ